MMCVLLRVLFFCGFWGTITLPGRYPSKECYLEGEYEVKPTGYRTRWESYIVLGVACAFPEVGGQTERIGRVGLMVPACLPAPVSSRGLCMCREGRYNAWLFHLVWLLIVSPGTERTCGATCERGCSIRKLLRWANCSHNARLRLELASETRKYAENSGTRFVLYASAAAQHRVRAP